jgi:hypothetical protein
MLYIDYQFDLNDNLIIMDADLKLKGSVGNGTAWGNLPESWKEGDLWKLATGANGNIVLIKVKNETT